MAIDIAARKPVLSNRVGGLSGHAVKPVGIRAVWDVFENFDKPIFGVGGIENVQDAVEYIMAGAGALQIGTAVYSHGRGIFSKISTELASYMEKEGFNSIEEMRGLAHR
jgi:dihydroorotate dehydrogenase (NAD+) catalytic subunit